MSSFSLYMLTINIRCSSTVRVSMKTSKCAIISTDPLNSLTFMPFSVIVPLFGRVHLPAIDIRNVVFPAPLQNTCMFIIIKNYELKSDETTGEVKI